jgi:hypothetical protein
MLSDSETSQDAKLDSALHLEDVFQGRPILYLGGLYFYSQRSSTIAA